MKEEEVIEETPEIVDPPIVEEEPEVIVEPIVNDTVILDDIPINEDAAEF